MTLRLKTAQEGTLAPDSQTNESCGVVTLSDLADPGSPPPSLKPRQRTRLSPAEPGVSSFVNYTWKNGAVVSQCDNGAGTTEGLASDKASAELTSVM